MESYNNIYDNLQKEIDIILESLKEENEDASINEYRLDGINRLSEFKNQLGLEFKSLSNNAEWDVFTIAFYGETNAGKSTIIETLRILLNENSKVEQRKKYKETYYEYLSLKQNITDIDSQLSKLKTINDDFENEYDLKKSNINDEIGLLEDQWLENQLSIFVLRDSFYNKILNSLLSFIKSIFHHLDEQKEVDVISNELDDVKQKYKEMVEALNSLNAEKDKRINTYNEEFKNLSQQRQEKLNFCEEHRLSLYQLSDGKIINVSADYTQEVSNYFFEANNIKFDILDLPGIEGKEELVQDEIKKAIERAHVVFYVNNKATPPQSGNTIDSGTIGKIKNQLSMQSEVYFIYNKPISSPHAFKDTLIDDDENNSLNEVDQRMKAALGDNYIGHISLSAYPAFVAICNDFEGKLSKAQKKFLSKYSKNEILSNTGIEKVCDWIINQLTSGYKNKIIKSNFKKIKASIKNTSKQIDDLENNLLELNTKVNEDYENILVELNGVTSALKSTIESNIDGEVQKVINKTRIQVYALIDQGISNKELTIKLKEIVSEENKNLDENINNSIKDDLEDYQTKVGEIVERFEKYVLELMTIYGEKSSFKLDISLNITTHEKEKIFNLLVAIIDLIGLVFFKDKAIGVIVISAIGVVIKLGKEIHALFDSNYKKAQQKESVSHSLSDLKSKVDKDIEKYLDQLNTDIDSKVESIEIDLGKPRNKINQIILVFNKSKEKLDLLLHKVESEERNYYANDRNI